MSIPEMNKEKDSIQSALSVANILWPEFVVVDELIFFSWAAPDRVDLEQWHDRTEIESSLNHAHVLDLFTHGASLDEDPWWIQNHTDFLAACKFGLAWVEAVATKLARDFPEHRFFVYYSEQDNPIVRFHQEHAGETPWLSLEDRQEEIAAGPVVIYHVSGKIVRTSRRPLASAELKRLNR